VSMSLCLAFSLCPSEKGTSILDPQDFHALFLSMYAMVIKKPISACSTLIICVSVLYCICSCVICCTCDYYNLGEVIPSIGEKTLGRMISLCSDHA
jgi:hypothetical protein